MDGGGGAAAGGGAATVGAALPALSEPPSSFARSAENPVFGAAFATLPLPVGAAVAGSLLVEHAAISNATATSARTMSDRYNTRKDDERRFSEEPSLARKAAPGTRLRRYRCSLPGLAGFTALASPGTKNARWSGQRRERDSNPRYLSVHTISNRAPSATRSPLHERSPSRIDVAEGEGFEPPVLSHI